jgi:hypothetical protein
MLRGGCIEEYNQVARDYNAKLQDMLRRLQATHPGFKVAYVNVYQTMLDLINNPGTLGELRFVITDFFFAKTLSQNLTTKHRFFLYICCQC